MDLVAVLLFIGIFISAGFALAVNYLFPTNATLEQAMIGMIFAFFTTLFGASLVVPSVLMKIIKKVKNRYLKSSVMARHLTLAAFIL